MNVDYTAIADRAVALIGGADPSQYMVAYNSMKNETVPPVITYKVLNASDVRRWLLSTTTAQAEAQAILTSAASNDLKAVMAKEILLGSDGLDLNQSEVLAAVDSMLSVNSATSLKNVAKNPGQPRWGNTAQNVLGARIYNALQGRVAGRY